MYMCKYMPNIRGYHSLTYNVWSLKGPARWKEHYYHTAQLQTTFYAIHCQLIGDIVSDSSPQGQGRHGALWVAQPILVIETAQLVSPAE